MRRLALASIFLLAACATRPEQPVEQPAPAIPQLQPQRQVTRLTGLSAQDLVGHFGRPALQVQEGNSVKLQFRGSRCVLDAYLYPSGSAGTMRVTHVDTRLPTGADTPQAACTAALGTPAS